jgi:hypothetical protein
MEPNPATVLVKLLCKEPLLIYILPRPATVLVILLCREAVLIYVPPKPSVIVFPVKPII